MEAGTEFKFNVGISTKNTGWLSLFCDVFHLSRSLVSFPFRERRSIITHLSHVSIESSTTKLISAKSLSFVV